MLTFKPDEPEALIESSDDLEGFPGGGEEDSSEADDDSENDDEESDEYHEDLVLENSKDVVQKLKRQFE